MRRSVRFLGALAPLLVAGGALAAPPLPNVNAYHGEAPQAGVLGGVLDETVLPPAFVASRDAQRSVPTFLWAIQPAATSPAPLQVAVRTPEEAARAHLAAHAPRYGLSPAALSTASVVRVLDLGRGGVVVVMRQSVGGVPLFHSDVKVLMDRTLGLVAIGGNLHAGAVPTPRTPGFVVSEAQAIASAFHDLYGAPLAPADVVSLRTQKAGYRYHTLAPSKAVTTAAIHLTEPVRSKPVFFPLPGRIVPAYFLEIIAQTRMGEASDAYAYVIAADDGRLLYRENLTHRDTFNFRVWADATGDKRPADGPLLDYTPHPTGMPDGTFPGPAMSQLIAIAPFNKTMDAWLPTGATQSQGNNVDAYTDDNNPEGFSPGDTRALSTSASTFDHTFDLTLGPLASLEQREAAVTDMFYVTNWLHDWWYDSGFDEQGGNAQTSNYGRGGVEGDPLLAEGQYGAPTQRNGSDTVVPADGTSPRMHLYVWNGVQHSSVTLQPDNQVLAAGVAAFGPQAFSGPGVVVLADDGTAPDVNDACEALVNGGAVSGNVALVNRGTCTFKTKVVNAQAAGAIGVIIVDNKAGEAPPTMADDASLTTVVTIPVLSISMADGATLKGELPGESATFFRSLDPDRDGTIDNTLVAHEWGHLLHLRHVECGTQQCLAESEGWADFDALMMVLRQGDDLSGTYALAQHAVASFPDDPAYFGIRRFPYSVDLTKSPLTFQYLTAGVTLPTTAPIATGNGIGANNEVHAAGEIWASMLFEGYVAMLQQTQGSSPPYTFDQARRRMSDYVVGGMSMAPTDPTYTEQRDALLATAAAADPKDLALLAQGFAKRGAGSCAVSPARDSTDLSGVVESFTVSSSLTVTAVTVDDSVTSCDGSNGYLDAGETGLVTVHVMNATPGPIAGGTATLTSTTPGITFPNGPTVTFGAVPSFTAAVGTAQIALASSFVGKQHLALTVTPNGAAGCGAGALSVAPYINVIEEPASALIDDVEAKNTTWTTSGTLAAKIWSRVEPTPGNHVWAGLDHGAASDTSLVSPPLTVSATTPFVMNFDHAHSFESSGTANFDGAVIEVSSDGGTTWNDVDSLGDPGYGGLIGDPMNIGTNVLQGRKGYVATNPSWPATDTVTIDMGTKLAGATVQVRFRIGTDEASGAPGWQVDNIWFQGITDKPFTFLAADTAACGSSSSSSTSSSSGGGAGGSGGGPSPSKPGGCGCVIAGDPGATLGGPLLALSALLLRRRRRVK